MKCEYGMFGVYVSVCVDFFVCVFTWHAVVTTDSLERVVVRAALRPEGGEGLKEHSWQVEMKGSVQ